MAVTTTARPAREEKSSPASALWQAVRHGPLSDYYVVAGVSLALIVIGVMMVTSASSVVGRVRWHDAFYFVKRQVAFLFVGLVVAWWLSRRSPRVLNVLGHVGLWGSALLLCATFVPGLGISVNGNRNWIQLGTPSLRLQPSEFAKLALVVWGASTLATKQKAKLLDQPKHLLVPLVPVWLIMTLLVVMERDQGTAMVMIAILLGLLWVVGTSWRILAAMAASGAAIGYFLITVSSSRMRRLDEFLHPTGAVDQPMRAMYALASGGWWGRGLGNSRQKWGSLAEAHTDFVFAILGEELGLIGSLLVVALFLVLGRTGLRIAMRSDNLLCRYTAAGITIWFMVQACVNILVVLRLLPVAGVPLPLISYGGSALLANLLALGVLLACARQEPEARRALATASKKPRPRLSTVVDGGRS